MEAQVIAEENPFAAAEEKFEELVLRLSAVESRRMTHSELESLIAQEGRATAGCCRGISIFARPASRSRLRCRARMASSGRTTAVARAPDRVRAGDGPADGIRGTPAHQPEPARCFAEPAGGVALSRAEATRSHRGRPGLIRRDRGGDRAEHRHEGTKRQVEELVARAAQDFDAFYDHAESAEAAANLNDLLILTLDGKGIVMRHEDLREATRKAAESAQHKLDRRLSRGEKKDRKRMATVAAVYDLTPQAGCPR